MSEGNNESLFSAEALRSRRAKPLSFPVLFLRLPTASAISLILISAVLAICWSIFAKVPIKVAGRAIVVNVNDVKPLITKTNGRILIIPPEISATRKHMDSKLFRFYNSMQSGIELPSLIKITNSVLQDTSAARYSNLSKLIKNASILDDISSSRFKVDRGQVVTIVFNENLRTKLSNDLSKAEKQYNINSSMIERNRSNLNSYKKQALMQYELILAYEQLEKEGAGSKVEIFNNKKKYDELYRQIRETESKISDLSKQNNSLSLEFETQLTSYINSTYVFSEALGYVSSLAKGSEQYSESNQPILFFSERATYELPSLIVGFTDDKSANLIGDGMKVIATPEGINKSQYGGIEGVITTKMPYTLTSKRLSNIVGIESLQNLAQEGVQAPNLIVVKLSKSVDSHNYKWTTGQIPPIRTGIGDVLNLDINVDNQSPLFLALPVFKKYLGLEGPTNFTESR